VVLRWDQIEIILELRERYALKIRSASRTGIIDMTDRGTESIHSQVSDPGALDLIQNVPEACWEQRPT